MTPRRPPAPLPASWDNRVGSALHRAIGRRADLTDPALTRRLRIRPVDVSWYIIWFVHYGEVVLLPDGAVRMWWDIDEHVHAAS